MPRLRVVALAAVLLGLLSSPSPAGAAPTTGSDHGAIVVVNGQVAVERGETVDGVFIAHGDARIAGRVDGDVVIASGDAFVSGLVDGDLVTLGGRSHLLAGAEVTGDVRYGDKRPLVAPAATVRGHVEKEGWTDSLDFLPIVGAFALWLAMTVSVLVLGILLLLIAPRAADAIFERARQRIGPVIAIGVAIFLVLPLAGIAYVSAAWALGRAIVKPPRERMLSLLAGVAIFRAAALVPILGLLVWLAAVIVGLGLIGSAIGAARERTVTAG